jgi:prophage tail gpP-like protein
MPSEPLPLSGDELEVVIAGEGGGIFTGWQTLVLERPLDSIAGGFELGVLALRPWPLQTGQAIQIRLAGEVLLDGHVEEFSGSTSRRGRALRISGRDKTGDLVDCAATSETGEFRTLSLFELVQQLAEPFGIAVESRHAKEDGEDWLELIRPFEKFAIRSGETAWSAIERAIRARGFLAFTKGTGTIVIERPASVRSAVGLSEGAAGNILRGKFTVSELDRFSTYTVRSQAPGTDAGWGETVAEIEGIAVDSNVERFRPWLDFGDTALTFQGAQERADWEAAIRTARAERIEIETQGWRRGPGLSVWRPNELVEVNIPSLGIETREMLVNRCRFNRSRAGGTTTVLELLKPDAYRPQPEVPTDDPFGAALESAEWGEE